MSTAGQIIAGSLRLIGAIASGETPSGNEQADALTALNALIESWSNENLLIPNKVREVFPLVGNQRTYTMGSGGDFDTTRPMKIEDALIQLTDSSPVLELDMRILTKDEYQAILLKTSTASFPMYVYPDNAFPLTTLSVWPVPTSSANNIVLYSWKPLTTLAAASTSISLPPGYERALRFNLAMEIAPEYGKSLSAEALTVAMESKASVKRTNTIPYFLRVDPELRGKPGVFNWRTGDLV